jgi:hypothetical protein
MLLEAATAIKRSTSILRAPPSNIALDMTSTEVIWWGAASELGSDVLSFNRSALLTAMGNVVSNTMCLHPCTKDIW